MKRLSCLLLGILLVFSLCACQQAAPSSGEAPDQQAITEEATEYFNQMMDGDFETFFNALPQGVQDNISAETIQETWEEEVDKLGGLPQNTSPDVSCYVPNTLTKSVLNLSFLVTKAISEYSSTISRMAAFTTMLSGRTKQNEKARYFYE